MATIPKIIDLVSDRLAPIIMPPRDEAPLPDLFHSASDPVQAAIDAHRFGEFELLQCNSIISEYEV